MFRDPALLTRAITHPSWLQDHPGTKESNQRLEFLGDAVLQLLLTEALFQLFPNDREGELSQRRASLTKGRFLVQLAREIGLDACLLLRQQRRRRLAADAPALGARGCARGGDRRTLPRQRPWSRHVRRVVLGIYGPLPERLARATGDNPKGRLQELVQPRHGNDALRYEVTRTEGADHARAYEVSVFLLDRHLGTGRGTSKKLAEEAAALEALKTLQSETNSRSRKSAEGRKRGRCAFAFVCLCVSGLPRFRDYPMSSVSPRHKLTGVCPPARGAVVAELARTHAAPVWLVVAEDLKAAEQLAEDIAFFSAASGNPRPLHALVFPESMRDSRDMREAFAASSDRLTVLSRLRATRGMSAAPDTLLVLTTPAALLQPVPALEEFTAREFTLARGQKQSFHGLLEQLQSLDYDSEAVCEAPGHYAIRGGIIDVYPVTANQPYRLDFFGDELEEIREFDPVTQRSGASVPSITLSASPRVRLGRIDHRHRRLPLGQHPSRLHRTRFAR